MKISWLLLACALVQIPTRADFTNGSVLEQPTTKIIHTPGESGITGYAYSWMRTMSEGGPDYVTSCEIIIKSTKKGRILKRIKSNAQGRFKIPLSPGIYSVQAMAQFSDGDSNRFNLYSLKQVGRVKPNQFRKVVLQFGNN